MKQLWRIRLGRHQAAQTKYLKRVFNDHFVLVLLVLFGALLYSYSNFVKNLGLDVGWIPPVLGGLMAITLPIGRLATMFVPADVTFLLPQAGRVKKYLTQAFGYSLVLPLVLQVLVVITAWPIMTGGFAVPVMWVVAVGVIQVGLKITDMALQLVHLYEVGRTARWARWCLLLLDWLFVTVGLMTSPVFTAIIALVVLAAGFWLVVKTLRTGHINMTRTVQLEQSRMGSIYRFYNLFTDVPGLSGGVKRRKILDPLLSWIKPVRANTWTYLFARGFLRSQEYAGLAVRLIVIGMIAEVLCTVWWMAVLVAVLFIYLLGFQLLPLAVRYREIVFTYLFPIPDTQRNSAWVQVVTVVLLVQALCVGVVPIVALHTMLSVVPLVAGCVAAILIPRILKGRIHQQ